MKLDGKDIGILVQFWNSGTTITEIDGDHKDNRRRVYRLRRAGMCGCSRQDDNVPGNCLYAPNPQIWGINPAGIEAIELAEVDYAGAWREGGWSMEFDAKQAALGSEERGGGG